VLARATRSSHLHALNERHDVSQRHRAPQPAVWVTAHGPRPFVVMGVGRQTAREVDASAIEELTAGRYGNEHRRVAVLGDADRRDSLRWFSRHVLP
jgi:hypothetical protein